LITVSTYTQELRRAEIDGISLDEMPVILQQYLHAKLDLRVTVIGNRCWAASVTTNGKGIEGDWRLAKREATFELFQLPEIIEQLCIKLVQVLGLTYGAIDLAIVGRDFYFLEINPTGEWGWLVEMLGFPIHLAIADVLV
jgi:glutathione synthase/RimK-type ligase-like ATP-grasp enzyme